MDSAALRHVGSSWSREGTCVPCTGRRTPNSVTREVPENISLWEYGPFLGDPRTAPSSQALTGHTWTLTHTKPTETGRYTQVLVITVGPSRCCHHISGQHDLQVTLENSPQETHSNSVPSLAESRCRQRSGVQTPTFPSCLGPTQAPQWDPLRGGFSFSKLLMRGTQAGTKRGLHKQQVRKEKKRTPCPGPEAARTLKVQWGRSRAWLPQKLLHRKILLIFFIDWRGQHNQGDITSYPEKFTYK